MRQAFELKQSPAERVTVINSFAVKGLSGGHVHRTIMVTFVCSDGSTGSMDSKTFREFYRAA